MKPKTNAPTLAEINAAYRLGVNTTDDTMEAAELVFAAAAAVRDKAWRDFHNFYDKLGADLEAALQKLETAK